MISIRTNILISSNMEKLYFLSEGSMHLQWEYGKFLHIFEILLCNFLFAPEKRDPSGVASCKCSIEKE